MARYDTTQLANTVIRDAKIPAGSSYRDNDNEKILAIATEEQEAVLVPELIKVQGGHLMAYADTVLASSTIRYRLPERAIRPERVVVVNSAGALIARLPLASGDMVDEVLAGFTPRGDAIGYWAPENNHAVVALRDSVLQSGHSLRIYYRRQPNALAAVGGPSGGIITTLNVVGSVTQMSVTMSSSSNATAFDTALNTQTADIQTDRPPFEATVEDLQDAQHLNFTTYVRVDIATADMAITPSAGDGLCLTGYCVFPQLPVAFHAVLAAYTTARVLREMGNTRAADLAQLAADRKLQSALTTITPRGDDAETTVDEVWLTGG
jgi:hypothetical protein